MKKIRSCEKCGIDLRGHCVFLWEDKPHCLTCLAAVTYKLDITCTVAKSSERVGETDFVFARKLK